MAHTNTQLSAISTCIILIIIISGAFSQKTVSGCNEVTVFDYVCKAENLYRPYMKYYRGRESARTTGKPLSIRYPGVYVDFNDADYQNAYLCVNGFAWLYFTIKDHTTRVYDTTELHSFTHYCFLVNGVSVIILNPGEDPPRNITVKSLKGIYLMGNQKDYRLPDIHTFTAPYTDANVTFNATSVVIIGNTTECLLERGEPSAFRNATSVRISGKRTSFNSTTNTTTTTMDFCTLQYKNIDTQVETNDAGKAFLPAFFSHKNPVSTPRHDLVIKKKKCVANPVTFDENAATYVEKKADNITTTVTDLKAKFKDDVEKFFVGTYVDTATNVHKQLWTPEPCAQPEECTPRKIMELLVPIQATLKNETNKTSTLAIAAKYNLTIIPMYPCASNVLRMHKAIKNLTDGGANSVETIWKKAKDEGAKELKDALTQQKLDLDDFKKKEEAWTQAGKPGGTDVKFTEYDAALKKLETQNKTVETASLKLGQQVADAEAAEASMEALDKLLTKGLADFLKKFEARDKSSTDPKCVYMDIVDLLAGTTTIAGIKVDNAKLAVVKKDKHPTKFDGDVKDLTCGSFFSPKEACDNAKPTKARAAAILRSRINVFKDFNATPPNDTDFPDDQKWRNEIFHLMEDVYNVACGSVINHEFVIGVNRIIKGYLMNFVPDTINGTLPLESGGWTSIRRFLRKCETTRQPPKFAFTYIQRAKYSDRFFMTYQKAANSVTEDVYENVEQVQIELSLNWAIDSFWRIFSTVLGFCIVPLETDHLGISQKFYRIFQDDFLTPLMDEWKSPRDNVILEHLMGEYYETRQDIWATMCMEGMYLLPLEELGNVTRILYRPLRNIPVNRGTEPNFINDDGTLQYFGGIYAT